MTLLEQCQIWHEQNEHQKIVDLIQAMPEEERTPEADMELARAYNNLADPEAPEGRELLRRAIELLRTWEKTLSEDYSWNFRLGYAYYYLDQEGPALQYFQRALELHPGDMPQINTEAEIRSLIEDCRRRLALPRFEKSFRERTAEAWAAFEAGEAELRQMMGRTDRDVAGGALMERCGTLLEAALPDIAFELGFNGDKYELILSPEGETAKLFPLVYFQRHAPEAVTARWNIWVGRQPNQGLGLQLKGWELSAEEVQVWAEQQGERGVSLKLYCEKLLPLLREEEGQAWWMLSNLTDQVLGEVAAMEVIRDFTVAEIPDVKPAIPLTQLPQVLREMGFSLENDAGEYLKHSYQAYQREPEEGQEADWRMDVYAGATRLPALIGDYLSGESGTADAFYQDGIAAGFLYYPLESFDGEERGKAILDFRDALEAAILEQAGEDAVTFLGGATGVRCGYLDFLAWDLQPVLEAAADFLERSPVAWAGFHSFRRDVEGVPLKQEKTEPSGPILTPKDVAELNGMCGGVAGYFHKMLHYLDERIRAGVREGRFTQEQARADLDVALWYSYACNNVDEYEYYYRAAQWMPASEQAAEQAGCGMWYYRYACALIYCSRLKEALAYARKGVELDPDYVWGWLVYAKLLSHFGDREGALAAVDRGLALEPGDYEFTTLRREIREGRGLEEMEYHWIDPECDRRLQEGLDENGADKKRAISHILCDRENLEAIRSLLAPTEWEGDAPYCTFSIPYQDRTLSCRFFGNEAAFSKLPVPWVGEVVQRLPELDRRGRTFLSARAGLGTEGLQLDRLAIRLDRELDLFFQREEEGQAVRFLPDFSLHQEQPALEQPEGGSFLAFVLLEGPEWDADQFKRELRDQWGIPCMTEETDGEDGETALIFEWDGMLAAVSLFPFPVPGGEAEENAAHNYLWPEAEETARRHQGHLLISVQTRQGDPIQGGQLQVKLVCAACEQEGVLGIYANGTVYQKEFYQEAAGLMEDGSLPLLNLVWPGLWRREGGLCGYTEGMRAFGKDEMEVLDADAEPGDLRGFLLDIADYLLENDVTLHDGETIGFSQEDKHAITRSGGVFLPGMTLKIKYD